MESVLYSMETVSCQGTWGQTPMELIFPWDQTPHGADFSMGQPSMERVQKIHGNTVVMEDDRSLIVEGRVLYWTNVLNIILAHRKERRGEERRGGEMDVHASPDRRRIDCLTFKMTTIQTKDKTKYLKFWDQGS
ncbi:putative lysosomal cobalamin transporter [Frankliniella fusca]|uniref:Lysosomal cobalamin transporter n=1 Tax=Frankliniella fusca TaxID=407009 RepID=A0AAE1I3S8_9NEOP|nr:putative lysosomal cobalamin transporter [Frankliniella fusca]